MRFIYFLFFFSVSFLATAQLQISHPMARLVVQRGADGTGRLYVAGRLTGAADRIEGQLTPVSAGQGSTTGWQTIQTNPQNGIFLGYITAPGGWYVLTIRLVVNNTVTEQTSVQPVGIGEVFITAGQSNARGLGSGDNDLGTATNRVNAIDSINHYYPSGSGRQLVSSGDPSPVPVYKALTAGKRVFPMAESSWGWGELGDYIVNRYNVPVAFYVTGWDGSTIDNWQKTANGQPTCNAYFCNENWVNLQPYTNLKNVLQYYGSVAGVRAVLWHQGEAEGDVAQADIPQYANRFRDVVQRARQDFGGQTIPWVIARTSFNGSKTTPAVIQQQEAAVDPANQLFQGPLNDSIMNRNGGNVDVHFRNAFRPAVHPQYYLNPTSIPANMGLSRFARNWNNSLNNSFFQNSQPITPNAFAATGTVTDYVLPGSSLSVSFATSGTFAGGNQWQVQLLDSVGHYLAVLGNGPASPVAVQLPASYQSGRYQVRVVASAPALPAVPSNLFRIVSQLPAADLSLAMTVNQRTADPAEQVTISLTVRNDGPSPAQNVALQNRLPPNLNVVSLSSGLSSSSSVVSGMVTSLPVGAEMTLSFVATPNSPGTYRNAAQITTSSLSDPDSQPNSGTGDGQDDATTVDFRTRQPGALFESPNPDQVPLPPVQSSQPVPEPNKADISLSLASSTRTPQVNEIVSFTITLSNAGGLAATGLSVGAYLSANLTLVPGDDLAPGGGGLAGGISSIPAGGQYLFRFRARATDSGYGLCHAQLTATNQPDPDSTPNNGTTNGEDDTAQIDLRVL